MSITDTVTAEGIKKRLPASLKNIDIEIYPSLDSTNILCAERIREGCRPWHTVITEAQTHGQGRLGRSFFSPTGSGLYMSTVMYPEKDNKDTALITGCAAVCAIEAIEEVFSIEAQIKWVNDIFIGKKKVAGILAKGMFATPSHPDAVILGIGLNVYEPEVGFPDDIKDTAGYISKEREEGLREKLCASLLARFYSAFENLSDPQYVEKYRNRCITLSRDVTVLPSGSDARIEARALDIDRAFHLKVRYPDGREDTLSSGEVSVRL
ncbi:MAG: biotin--[Clostridia bacterium]|nr:biotin--[acetyl-CoA-carboxylase] ligase [Clostridia bacterium]